MSSRKRSSTDIDSDSKGDTEGEGDSKRQKTCGDPTRAGEGERQWSVRDMKVTLKAGTQNARPQRWGEEKFAFSIVTDSWSYSFCTSVREASPDAVTQFANQLGQDHCYLNFVDYDQAEIQCHWDNDEKSLSMSSWSDDAYRNSHHEFKLHLKTPEEVNVFRQLLLSLTRE